tara:strand:+ start:2812 stop:3024 length:213 start_codon:yes stop_codon:yes gene_type:complete
MHENILLVFLVAIVVMLFLFFPHLLQVKENYRGYSLQANIGIGVAVFLVIVIIAVHFIPSSWGAIPQVQV